MTNFFNLRGRPTIKTQYEGIPECALPRQHEIMFGKFATTVSAGSRVLDLASGMGAWARRLADNGYNVTACDIRSEICQVACERVDLNQNFSNRFGACHYDAVTAIEMLEHLENPRHILRESNKLLRDGGTFMLSTPNASGLHSRVKFLATGRFAQFDDEQYNSIGHIRPLTYWELDKILTEAGFAITAVTFHNNHDFLPRTIGEVIKLGASIFLRPFVRGTAGGQVIIIVAKKLRSLDSSANLLE